MWVWLAFYVAVLATIPTALVLVQAPERQARRFWWVVAALAAVAGLLVGGLLHEPALYRSLTSIG